MDPAQSVFRKEAREGIPELLDGDDATA